MSAHTPGPWHVCPGAKWRVGLPGLAKTIDALNTPNARLIAAAPDLLAALRDMEFAFCVADSERITEKMAALERARAAIAAAEGK